MASMSDGGSVENDGQFSYPFLGRVKAGGKTAADVSAQLRARLAEGYRRAGAHRVRSGRLPLMPLEAGVILLRRFDLGRERGRGHRLGEDADAAAVLGLLRLEGFLQGRLEDRPGLDLALEVERLEPVGIVQRKHRRLRQLIARERPMRPRAKRQGPKAKPSA